MRKLTLAWWSCPLAFTWDAWLYHRCRFLPVVVIKFGASPPRERRTEAHKPSRRKAREVRSCDAHDAFTRVLFLRERAAPRRLNRRATMRRSSGVVLLVIGGREWEIHAGRRWVPRSAKGQRAGARRNLPHSRLEPDWNAPPSERVRVEKPTWGADRRQHASPRPVVDAGCPYRRRCCLIPMASVGWKTFI